MVLYCLDSITTKFIFESDVDIDLTKRGLTSENNIHNVKVIDSMPEIVNSIRRSISTLDSCAFPDVTLKQVYETREITYYVDKYITPFIEFSLLKNNIYKMNYEKINPYIKIIKNTSNVKNETIIRHLSMIPINLEPEVLLSSPESFVFELKVENNLPYNTILNVTSKDIKFKESEMNDKNEFDICKIFESSCLLDKSSELYSELVSLLMNLHCNTSIFELLDLQFIHILHLHSGQEIHVEMMPMISSGNHNACFDQFCNIILYHLEDPKKVENFYNKIVNEEKNEANTSTVEKKDVLKDFELLGKQRLVYSRDNSSVRSDPTRFQFSFQCNVSVYNSGKSIVLRSLLSIKQSIQLMIENLRIYRECDSTHPLKSTKTPDQNILINSTIMQNVDDYDVNGLNVINDKYVYITITFPEVLESRVLSNKKVHVNIKNTIDLVLQIILHKILLEPDEITEKSLTIDFHHVQKLLFVGVSPNHPLRDSSEMHFIVEISDELEYLGKINDSTQLKIIDKKRLCNFSLNIIIDYFELALEVIKKIIAMAKSS